MQQRAHDRLENLARFGIATKGVVYLIIGGLATWAAIGAGGAVTDQQGALQTIGQQPFGQALLWATAIGLFGYALWKGAQAITDADHEGTDAKGVVKRVGYGVSAVVHLSLAAAAVGLALGSGGGGGGTQDWTARLMAQPAGPWLVGIVGAIVIGVGLYQLAKAWKADFMDKLHTRRMSPKEERTTRTLGRIGHAARAVVFGIMGGFLISAALSANPEEARGLGGALRSLQGQGFGPWLLGIVALGLVAYAIFTFAQARYREVEV